MSTIPRGSLHHVGIAVADLDAACERYCELLNAEVVHREAVGREAEVAYLAVNGAAQIELVAPIGEDSPIAAFLDRHREGLHHLCIAVEDLDTVLAGLKAASVPLVDEKARPGSRGSRIAFLHPTATGGVLLELKEEATPS